ncbi:MAG: Mrp/NBP35 family ATP-binding protein [Candidatus Thiodiazotropha sp. (ex Epidulcina cf. delphinae)]|nr:Mrp/NBP35 family ATP-binding protein [Candidatus Thiodiazotropha sp. (ex Epidulcina cf. delphinae)]
MQELEERVLDELRRVQLGVDGPDLVSAGQVYDVVATGGAVRILLDPENMPDGAQASLAEAIAPLVETLPGVERVVVKPRPRSIAKRQSLPGIRHVVGIHSGKGGVGKSTLTVNLAVALAEQGVAVGLLDADVYGPSVPTLLGVEGRAEITEAGSRIEPKEAFGVRMMSLGLLLPGEQALIWRGSLIDEGLPQLFSDIAWGDLDILLVDLPPGTSDVHLAVARYVALSGVITVTAPGQVSIDDVRRGLEMFADLAVPSLGLVENMAGFSCRKCGETRTLFGNGGTDELSAMTGVPILASLPFAPGIALDADNGYPTAKASKGRGACFHDLARKISDRLKLSERIERGL